LTELFAEGRWSTGIPIPPPVPVDDHTAILAKIAALEASGLSQQAQIAELERWRKS
jgi:hypothetical protein